VEDAWEQKKLEASLSWRTRPGKNARKRGRIPSVQWTQEDGGAIILGERNRRTESGEEYDLDKSILGIGKHASRTKQWRRAWSQSRGAPWFPVKLI
jgi:hypothetical protein